DRLLTELHLPARDEHAVRQHHHERRDEEPRSRRKSAHEQKESRNVALGPRTETNTEVVVDRVDLVGEVGLEEDVTDDDSSDDDSIDQKLAFYPYIDLLSVPAEFGLGAAVARHPIAPIASSLPRAVPQERRLHRHPRVRKIPLLGGRQEALGRSVGIGRTS